MIVVKLELWPGGDEARAEGDKLLTISRIDLPAAATGWTAAGVGHWRIPLDRTLLFET